MEKNVLVPPSSDLYKLYIYKLYNSTVAVLLQYYYSIVAVLLNVSYKGCKLILVWPKAWTFVFTALL